MKTKFVKQSEFAVLAGVSKQQVSKIVKTTLSKAYDGTRINVNHPDAQKYLEKCTPVPAAPAPGIDPLYEKALAHCKKTARWSSRGLKEEFHIGSTRAQKIMKMFKLAGVIPKDPVPEPEEVPAVTTADLAAGYKVKEVAEIVTSPADTDYMFEVPEDLLEFVDMTLREILVRFGTTTRFNDFLAATQKIEAINEKQLKNAQTEGKLVARSLVQKTVIDVYNEAHLRLLKDGAKSVAATVVSKHASGAEMAEIEGYVSDMLASFLKPVKTKIRKAMSDA